MKADQELERYLTEAGSWDSDRASQARRSTRIAWWFAGAGWSCALAVAMALMLLMPFKALWNRSSVRVDNSTGIVDVVPVYAGHARMEEPSRALSNPLCLGM